MRHRNLAKRYCFKLYVLNIVFHVNVVVNYFEYTIYFIAKCYSHLDFISQIWHNFGLGLWHNSFTNNIVPYLKNGFLILEPTNSTQLSQIYDFYWIGFLITILIIKIKTFFHLCYAFFFLFFFSGFCMTLLLFCKKYSQAVKTLAIQDNYNLKQP